ncbi:hypothetical protein CEY16_03720 [Halalkalibacillus sediminis]|uniref:Uncharacterized protein n=1 Tax=Halalkalibacillus sediminis TaxID=2018042 RepID=A0A2I0QX42_9BACI|nr:hypothetical protein [Halalkalibacillus sediminis]PKR78875.1 hypothetical protein CEY16_03720 [Halalkalibacillus sediminis]
MTEEALSEDKWISTTEDEEDIYSLPPRSRKNQREVENEEEVVEHPSLFIHRVSIHVIMVLFILLTIGIPIIYSSMLP